MGNKPEDHKDTAGEKKPAVLQNLLLRASKNKITVVAILAAAIVVLFAVIIATVKLSPLPPSGSAANVNHTGSEQPSFEDLSKEIRLVLFEHNIGAEAVAQSYNITGGKSVHTVTIAAPETSAAETYDDLAGLLQKNNLHVSALRDNLRISGEAKAYRVEIILETFAEEKPAPPGAGDAPLPLLPAEGKKNKFGLTPPPKGNARMALLIDDAGMNTDLAERLGKIKVFATYSILPHMPYSRQTAEIARKYNKSVFLHFPMEPENYPATDPGPGAVLLSMPDILIKEVTKSNVESIGLIDGANNHMGSAFTADRDKIRQALESLREYTDTFVDSNTSSKSVALSVCRELGMKCGINKKFIDNENNHAYIASKIYEAAALASKNGGIILIGHLRPDTIAVLEYVVPELQALGYKFVPLSELTK